MIATIIPAMLVSAIGLGSGFLGISVLLLRRVDRRWAPHETPLLLLLAAVTLHILLSAAEENVNAAQIPWLIGVSHLVWPAIPIGLWSYVSQLTSPGARGPCDRRVALIAALLPLLLIPLLLLSGADKLALVEDQFVPTSPLSWAAVAGSSAFLAFWALFMTAVWIGSLRRLRQHRRRLRDLCSSLNGRRLLWLDGLLYWSGGALLLFMLAQGATISSGLAPLDGIGGALFELSLVTGFALFGIEQGRPLPVWVEQVDDSDGPDGGSLSTSTVASPGRSHRFKVERYARSALSVEDCAEIAERMDSVMRRETPWRDPFLDLKALASLVGVKPHYLSQALSEAHHRNFYDYVNGWRVRAACDALAAEDMTILAVAEQSGFNTKSTFNAAFRKETGITPSAWRRKENCEHATC